MKAFVVRCKYEDEDSYDWPRIAVLGKRADILANRMIEYAGSIAPAQCKPQVSSISVSPFDLQNWLAMQKSTEVGIGLFVAIAGALGNEEHSLLDLVLAMNGKYCVILADSQTPLEPAWQSAIRLPPHCSWDTQWAWGIRVVLDVLLEAALHRGMICIDPADIQTCIVGRYSELAVAHADGDDRAIFAVRMVIESISKRMDLMAADAFILTFNSGSDFHVKEISSGLEELKDTVDQENAIIMGANIPADGNQFTVTLIASVPFERSH